MNAALNRNQKNAIRAIRSKLKSGLMKRVVIRAVIQAGFAQDANERMRRKSLGEARFHAVR